MKSAASVMTVSHRTGAPVVRFQAEPVDVLCLHLGRDRQRVPQALVVRDRALVWRVTGGKHRYLIDQAQVLVPDAIEAFAQAAERESVRSFKLKR